MIRFVSCVLGGLFAATLPLHAAPPADAPPTTPGETVCGAPPYTRAMLETLTQTELAAMSAPARRSLALALLPCLEVADPVMRDDIAFRVIARLMRNDYVDDATLRTIERELRGRLRPNDGSNDGFAHAFAVLVLADVAGVDARRPFLTERERARLLDAATRYMRELRDWRGFDPKEGWRHGVAHGADLLERLAANPAFDATHLAEILDAIAHQTAPDADHYYIYGESERLAAAAVSVAQRGLVDARAWAEWLDRVSGPGRFENWNAVYGSSAGLARRHDTYAFLAAFELALRDADDAKLAALAAETARRRRTLQ